MDPLSIATALGIYGVFTFMNIFVRSAMYAAATTS